MRFGLLENREWFVVPESKPASDPSKLFSMLGDDICLVNYLSYWESQILKDWRQFAHKGTSWGIRVDEDCASHLHAIFEFLGLIWSRSSYAVTLASCSPVFLRSIKTLFEKSCHGTPITWTTPLLLFSLSLLLFLAHPLIRNDWRRALSKILGSTISLLRTCPWLVSECTSPSELPKWSSFCLNCLLLGRRHPYQCLFEQWKLNSSFFESSFRKKDSRRKTSQMDSRIFWKTWKEYELWLMMLKNRWSIFALGAPLFCFFQVTGAGLNGSKWGDWLHLGSLPEWIVAFERDDWHATTVYSTVSWLYAHWLGVNLLVLRFDCFKWFMFECSLSMMCTPKTENHAYLPELCLHSTYNCPPMCCYAMEYGYFENNDYDLESRIPIDHLDFHQPVKMLNVI